MKTTTTPTQAQTPDLWIALRAKHSEIFADSLGDTCDAEKAAIHAFAPNCEICAACVPYVARPIAEKTYSSHPEEKNEIFADGSLSISNNGGREVWAFAGDFASDRIDLDTCPLGLRRFFGISEVADDDAEDFAVNIERFFYGVSCSENLAENEQGKALSFATRAEADEWIKDNAPDAGELYRCSYNEYARPVHTVFAR
jgi:hypothetical protein